MDDGYEGYEGYETEIEDLEMALTVDEEADESMRMEEVLEMFPFVIIESIDQDERYAFAEELLRRNIHTKGIAWTDNMQDGTLNNFYNDQFEINLQPRLVVRRNDGALFAIRVATKKRPKREPEWHVSIAKHLHQNRWLYGTKNLTWIIRDGMPANLDKRPGEKLRALLEYQQPDIDPSSFALDSWRWRIVGGYTQDLRDIYGAPDTNDATYSHWFACNPPRKDYRRPIFSLENASRLTRKPLYTPAEEGVYKRLPDPYRRNPDGTRRSFRSNLVVEIVHLHRDTLNGTEPDNPPDAPEGYRWYNWFTLKKTSQGRDDMGLFADRDFAQGQALTYYDGYVYSAGQRNRRPVGFARVKGGGKIDFNTKYNDHYDLAINRLKYRNPNLNINVDAGDYDLYEDQDVMNRIVEDIVRKEGLEGAMHHRGPVQAPRLGRRPWQFAHKMNHHANPNARSLDARDTLLWGDYYGIGFVSAARDVRRGEELSLNYGYDVQEGLFDPTAAEQMLETRPDENEPEVTPKRRRLILMALSQDYTTGSANPNIGAQALFSPEALSAPVIGQRFDGALVDQLAMLSIGRTTATPRLSAAAAPLRRPASLRTPGRR